MKPTGSEEMTEERIILVTDDDAAKFVTNIEGWASRNGMFYGNKPVNENYTGFSFGPNGQTLSESEYFARLDGATHRLCDDCGAPVEKSRTACTSCREKHALERYNNRRPKAHTDEPLYSEIAERFFWDIGELEDYCEEESCKREDLRLLICDAHYATEIDPSEHYRDDTDEDGTIPDEIEEAFKLLNETIRQCKSPLAWFPGDFRAVFAGSEVANNDKTRPEAMRP